jgi:hypothetical protein
MISPMSTGAGESRRELAYGAGWECLWEVSWRRGARELMYRFVSWCCRGRGCGPWRHHGFESLEEQRFLLTLDLEFQ